MVELVESVKKTGHLVVASEDVLTCGFTSEVAACIAEDGIYYLDAPVKRVAVDDTPIPFAPAMEKDAIPGEENIIEAVRTVLN